MRRVFFIGALLVLAAIAGVAGGAAFLFTTTPGRALLRDMIEPRLASALGGDADIGALEGAPPGRIVLRDIVLSDARGVWATVDRLELDWRPLAALGGEIDIGRLTIDGLALLDTPPERARPASDQSPAGFAFPKALPDVEIAEFFLSNAEIRETITGRSLSLHAAGRLAMGGNALDARLTAKSDEDRDIVNLALLKEPGNARLTVDILITSEADGAIASIAGLNGRLHLEAEGASPVNDFQAAIKGDIGAYGSIDGKLSGDLEDARALRLEADVEFGPALAGVRAEIGDSAAIAATLTPTDNGGVLDIDRFTSAAGEIKGRLSWKNRRGALAKAEASVTAAFAGTYRPDMQAYLGPVAAIDLALNQRRDAYVLTGAASSPLLSARLTEGDTDLRGRLTGIIEATFAARSEALLALAEGGSVNGRIRIDGEEVGIDDLAASLGDGTSFGGRIAANLAARTFSASGAGEIAPRLARSFVKAATLSAPLTFEGEAGGAFDQFEASLEIDAPSFTMNDTTIPASTVTAALTGLPSLPSGEAAAKLREGHGRIEAQIRSSADGRVRFPSLLARGRGFAIDGSGAYDPGAATISVDLAYEGNEDAEPWPGVPLAGTLTVAGTIGRSGAGHALKIDAPALASTRFALSDFKAEVSGPPGDLAVAASARAIEATAYGRLDDFALAGSADIREGVLLTLTRIEGSVRDLRVGLDAPARIRLVDGVTIENLRARFGAVGRLALDAAITPARWRATLSARQAPLRRAASLADIDLDLDTDRDPLATGAFAIRSELIDAEHALVSGNLAWAGDTLRVTNSKPDDAIDLDVRLPLRLKRAPAISIAFEGSLSGEARYAGPAEAVAAYLPPLLQSIEGKIEAVAELAGETDRPLVSGSLTLSDGAYTEFASGLSLAGIEARAVATPNAGGSTIALTASARGPRQSAPSMTLEGAVTLAEAVTLDAHLRLTEARLSAGPVNEAAATGEVRLAGPINDVIVSGDISVSELDAEFYTPDTTGLVGIEVRAIDGAAAPTETGADAPVPAPPSSIAFEISVEADDRVFIRGRGLESEWRADVDIIGTATEPIILGALDIRRGFIDFAGRRFELTRGRIAFDRLSTNNPVLDLRAEYETDEGVVAAIEIRGRGQSPGVSLVSTPPLPTEDVMALVLFGKSATELSAIESLQIAQSLAQLGGIGGFGGGGLARRALGLDLLNIDFDPETGAGSLAIGKYVAEGLFISATQDARGEHGAVRLQYEISRAITVETEIKQNGDQTISANWKRDF